MDYSPRVLVSLRLTLVVATGYLLLAQEGRELAGSWPLLLILAGAVASNLLVRWIPGSWFARPSLMASIVVLDTAWVTAAMISSGRFTADFFFLYFFVLFLATVGERVGLIVLGSVVVSGAYLWALHLEGGAAAIWTSSSLVRIPFLFAVAIFYGYLVDRLRTAERRATSQAEAASRSEQARRQLAAAYRELALEMQERQRAEKELRTLSRALDQSPTMMVVTGVDGRIEYVNPRVPQRTGLPVAQLIDRPLPDLFVPASVEEALAAPALQLGPDSGGWHGEIQIRTAEGEPFWASASISPIRDDDGGVRHQVAVLEDITARRRAADDLQQANDELKHLNDLKTTFVSIVSHELRTPVTAIRNAIHLLSFAGSLSDDQRRFVDMAHRNTDRLATLLSDLLAVSKLEAGKLKLAFAGVETGPLVDDVATPFVTAAEEASVRLEVDLSPNLPPVWADGQRVAQVISNLLSNALKFTPARGSIRVTAREVEPGVEIAVQDDGVGIAPEHHERVFERFFQVDDLLTRAVEGSGLGLAIARDLLRAQGSDLKLESDLGQGSRFSFVLPRHTARAVEMTELDAALATVRANPSNSILVLAPRPEDENPLPFWSDWLRSRLPRDGDLLVPQLAWRRIIVVLQATHDHGAEVVANRLREDAASAGIGRFDLHGPAVFPRDADTAWGVVTKALGTASTKSRPDLGVPGPDSGGAPAIPFGSIDFNSLLGN